MEKKSIDEYDEYDNFLSKEREENSIDLTNDDIGILVVHNLSFIKDTKNNIDLLKSYNTAYRKINSSVFKKLLTLKVDKKLDINENNVDDFLSKIQLK